MLPLARALGRESGQEERKPERKEVGGDVSAESGEAALQTDEKDSAKTAQDPNCCTVGVAQGGGGLGGVKEERGRCEMLVGTEMLPGGHSWWTLRCSLAFWALLWAFQVAGREEPRRRPHLPGRGDRVHDGRRRARPGSSARSWASKAAQNKKKRSEAKGTPQGTCRQL